MSAAPSATTCSWRRNFAATWPYIVFDPLPKHLGYLRERIALNGFGEEDFTIHELAVSDASGKAKLNCQGYGSALSSDPSDRGRRTLKHRVKDFIKRWLDKGPKQITTRAITLIEVFQQIGVKKIDLLQMDIQGFEERVLCAYFTGGEIPIGSGVDRFLIGTHSKSIHENCRSFLRQTGYEILCDEQATLNQPDGILAAEKKG